MNIISKYLAPWAIPNENIPLHIVWDPKENIQEIILIKPECLLIKEVFNANYIVENDLKVRFNNFESNGYFSAELISKEIEILEKKCNIILDMLFKIFYSQFGKHQKHQLIRIAPRPKGST